MGFFNKSFFAGVAAGAVLTVVVLAVASYLVFAPLVDRIPPVSLPPALPTHDVPLRAGADWKLRDLDGKPTSLAAFRGRVIFLNKWATWCRPCVLELPSIQALHDSLRSEDVAFVLVSDEDPAKVRAFVQSRRLTVPVYIAAEKPPRTLVSQGIPATYILDRSGNVMAEHVGAANWFAPECVAYLRRLLAR